MSNEAREWITYLQDHCCEGPIHQNPNMARCAAAMQSLLDEIERLTAELRLYRTGEAYLLAAAEIERLQSRVDVLESVLRAFPTIATSRSALIKRIKDWLPSRREVLAATEQEKHDE